MATHKSFDANKLLVDVENLIAKAEEILLQESMGPASGVAKQRRCLHLVEEVLVKELDLSRSVAHDIAFHLTDWWGELLFLAALYAYPERFTQEEIVRGISIFLAHAPNHVAAAAKLFDLPVQDIFGLGPLEEPVEGDTEL